MKEFKSDSTSALERFGRDKRARVTTAATERVERRPRPQRDAADAEQPSYDKPQGRASYNPNFTGDNRFAGDGKPRSSYGNKPSYGQKSYGDKPAYGNKPRSGEGSSEGRGYGNKPAYGSKPAYGNKPSYDRKPRTEGGEGEERRSYGDKPAYGNKPSYGQRSYGDKPAYGSKPAYGNKPSYDRKPRFEGGEGEERRSYGDKPAYGNKPSYGQRSYGDKPAYGSKPAYGNKPSYDRKPRFEGGEGEERRSYGDKPAYGNKPSYGNKPRYGEGSSEGRGYGNKPSFGNKPAYGDRKPGFKKFGAKPQGERRYDDRSGDKPTSYPRYNPNTQTGEVRLNRFIAQSGICSRREADDYITAGLVSVNGTIVTELGTKVMPTDEVKFNDSRVQGEKKVYLVMNKPKGYVTSLDDPHATKTVMDLIKDACTERIYPVGRLDKNSLGLLLFTNDGDLTKQLTHPSYKKKKIYQVRLDKPLTRADMDAIAQGITLEDGEIHADEISYVKEDKQEIGVEIHSGRNRIVRRIFEHLGYTVNKLDRVYYAGLTKKNLNRGAWRFLSNEEVQRLKSGQYE